MDALRLIEVLWPIAVVFVLHVIWLIRLEQRHNFLREKVADLEDKQSVFMRIIDKMSEIGERLARLEGIGDRITRLEGKIDNIRRPD